MDSYHVKHVQDILRHFYMFTNINKHIFEIPNMWATSMISLGNALSHDWHKNDILDVFFETKVFHVDWIFTEVPVCRIYETSALFQVLARYRTSDKA